MTDPDPLVPPDTDLRDFAYMPLDVVRVRDSEFTVKVKDAEFRAAVILWCASWHQVPASSLPDDDQLLAALAGFGRDLRSWKAVRNGALHGFIKCSDGRFYHPVIAEKAVEADSKRRSQHQRTKAATSARLAKQRGEQRNEPRNGNQKTERNVHQGKGIEENRREEKTVVDDSTRARGSRFSEDAHQLAPRILQAQGLNPADPAIMSATYFAQKWLDGGWQPDVIVTTIASIMTKRDKPPHKLNYFEQAIADAHTQFAKPLPRGSTGPPAKQSFAELAIELERRAHEPDYSTTAPQLAGPREP